MIKWLDLFESQYRRDKDRIEIASLLDKYGETAVDVVRERARDQALASRDRSHWKRIARKMGRHRHERYLRGDPKRI